MNNKTFKLIKISYGIMNKSKLIKNKLVTRGYAKGVFPNILRNRVSAKTESFI